MQDAPSAPATEGRRPAWHTREVAGLLVELESSERGLASAEAAARLARDGRNELAAAPPVRPLALFLAQWKSLLIAILAAAALLSGFLREWEDAIAIGAILVLNALIGFAQEFRAERSIAALRKRTAPRARVRRDGAARTIAAAEVVRGDVLLVEAGDLVAADARLLEAAELRCVESSLTGESEAVEKQVAPLAEASLPLGDRGNLLFMGTSVAAGSGAAVVVATGMQTEMGRIAGLLERAAAEAEPTPLQRRLQSFGRVLVFASLAAVALLFLLGWWRGTPLLDQLLVSVSLAVAAVPEGLPAIVTVALALGVMRMARRHALVRKLPAVETLGATSVILSDKTGTLTLGEMSVRELVPAARSSDPAALRDLALLFAGSSDAELVDEGGATRVVGDPTEGALLLAARKLGVARAGLERERPRVRTLPFDSQRKRMSIVRRWPDGRLRLLVKGAPDLLLERCSRVEAAAGVAPLDPPARAAIAADLAALAGRGLRVLAAAWREVSADEAERGTAGELERDLAFAGLAGLDDPPRPEVAQAVRRCRDAGIRVVMVTGDHPRTALAIAREIGIAAEGDVALVGAEIEGLSDDELARRLERAAVVARVDPEHKLRIARAFQARGEIVAMTGDGVNDAPAVRAADVGIAMGRGGTEVTKEAAQIVLADDHFATIVAAVEEGRTIWENLKKTLHYLLSGNSGELLFVGACGLIGLPAPLLPIHLLWINLATDGLPAICLATDPRDAHVMRRRPRRADEELADRPFLLRVAAIGLLDALVVFGVYRFALGHETLAMARTHAFTALVFVELLRSFSARSATRSILSIGLFSNLALLLVVALSIAFQAMIGRLPWLALFLKSEPIEWPDLALVFAAGCVPLAVLELVKFARGRLRSD
jgi:P-type Ca2+ transporter type 2C